MPKPKYLSGIFSALILAISIGTSFITASPVQAASTQTAITAAVSDILSATNAERKAAGLKPLILAPSMNSVAQNWAQQMAAQNQMVHNPNLAKEIHPDFQAAGENVAYNYSPKAVVPGWMRSPGHKANILGNYSHIGIGYWEDSAHKLWLVQVFGNYPKADIPPNAGSIPNTATKTNEFTSSWRASGDYITNYKLNLYSASGNLLQSKDLTNFDRVFPSITFTGLAPKTTYTVKRTAHTVNVMGTKLTSPEESYQVTTASDAVVVALNPPSELKIAPLTYDAPSGAETMVTWKAPTNVTGTIVDYTVVLKNDSGRPTSTYTSTVPNMALSALAGNVSYTVQVTANVIGKTDTTRISSPAATMTFKVPNITSAQISAPTEVKLSGLNFDEVVVSWKASSVSSGKFTSYLIEATPTSGTATPVSSTTTATSIKLSGLAPNQAYIITVKAKSMSLNNQISTTSISDAVTMTTPKSEMVRLDPMDRKSVPVTEASGMSNNRFQSVSPKPTQSVMPSTSASTSPAP